MARQRVGSPYPALDLAREIQQTDAELVELDRRCQVCQDPEACADCEVADEAARLERKLGQLEYELAMVRAEAWERKADKRRDRRQSKPNTAIAVGGVRR